MTMNTIKELKEKAFKLETAAVKFPPQMHETIRRDVIIKLVKQELAKAENGEYADRHQGSVKAFIRRARLFIIEYVDGQIEPTPKAGIPALDEEPAQEQEPSELTPVIEISTGINDKMDRPAYVKVERVRGEELSLKVRKVYKDYRGLYVVVGGERFHIEGKLPAGEWVETVSKYGASRFVWVGEGDEVDLPDGYTLADPSPTPAEDLAESPQEPAEDPADLEREDNLKSAWKLLDKASGALYEAMEILSRTEGAEKLAGDLDRLDFGRVDTIKEDIEGIITDLLLDRNGFSDWVDGLADRDTLPCKIRKQFEKCAYDFTPEEVDEFMFRVNAEMWNQRNHMNPPAADALKVHLAKKHGKSAVLFSTPNLSETLDSFKDSGILKSTFLKMFDGGQVEIRHTIKDAQYNVIVYL